MNTKFSLYRFIEKSNERSCLQMGRKINSTIIIIRVKPQDEKKYFSHFIYIYIFGKETIYASSLTLTIWSILLYLLRFAYTCEIVTGRKYLNVENAINALCFARNLASNCDFPKIKDGKYLARENRIDFPVGPREFVGNRSMRPVFAAFYQLSSLGNQSAE